MNNVTKEEHFAQMPVEQLEELLQGELRKQHPDEDTVLGIMAELEIRDKDIPVPEHIVRAWDEMQMNTKPKNTEVKRKHRKYTWLTWVAATAAVFCMLIMTVPQAVGAESIFTAIARWTDRIFSFDPIKAPYVYAFQTDNPDLQAVYEEITGYGIDQPVVPMWLPEGYQLDEIKNTETPVKNKIYVSFTNEDAQIILTINYYKTTPSYSHIKDERQLTEAEIAGIVHSITSNDGASVAAWNTENLECLLTVDGQETLLRKILKSIYFAEE